MLCEGLSYRFSDAIVRRPGITVTNGLRSVDHGDPDAEVFRSEHEAYVTALGSAGLSVHVLSALDQFPDSVFIEDNALCLPEGIIELRPGARSRTGEAPLTARALEALGHDLHQLPPGALVDGGDVLVTDRLVLVGISGRTNRAGFKALKDLLETWGYAVREVPTPNGVLHLKSDCCVLDSETILATFRLAGEPCFRPFRVLIVPSGEEPCTNSLRINGKVLVPQGYPATRRMLARAGYKVEAVQLSQAALLDGGLSCLSLRLWGPGPEWSAGAGRAPASASRWAR
jgi:dimethylargininase